MTIRIDPARDALVVVDLQNDFCPGGALGVAGGDAVIPVLNRYAECFVAAGAAVFASRDWHPAETTHFKASGGAWPPHCVQGTPGAEFHPELALPAETEVVSKGMDPREDAYSCFQAETGDGVPFAAALGELGVSRLFIGGLATDYCVKSTVVDGVKAGFEMVVLADAVAAVDLSPGDGVKALDEMRAAGARMIRLEDLA
jgi:nicotinamidase/pyrazinamidase